MRCLLGSYFFFFFQAEDGIRDLTVTGVQTCALPSAPACKATAPPWSSRRQRKSVNSSSRLARDLALVTLVLLAACSDSGAPGGDDPRADPRDAAKLALGVKLYAQHCSGCHGAKLEGQPNWRTRGLNGRMPAPPHDESGHTWHHPDRVLFGITKYGLRPPYTPKNYESDMPAFGDKLSD